MVSKAYNGFPAAYRDKQGGAVYKAFKSGALDRPNVCVMCGLTADQATVHAHNEDYHEPDTYVGLCYYCHMAVHKRFDNLRNWYQWRDLVCSGWQPPRNRDYRIFIRVWDNLPALTSQPDHTNWAWTLTDHEPDLYTPRLAELGLSSNLLK